MKKTVLLLCLTGFCMFIIPADSFAGAGTLGGPSTIEKQWCEEFCAEYKNDINDPCHFCSKDRNCGPGYQQTAEFGLTEKNRWFACTGDENDKKNQTACENWCAHNKPRCAKCSPKTGCGLGYKSIYTFGGKGKNWHACAVSGGVLDPK